MKIDRLGNRQASGDREPVGLHAAATECEMRAFYACCREDPYGDSAELLGKALSAKYGIEWIEVGELPKDAPVVASVEG